MRWRSKSAPALDNAVTRHMGSNVLTRATKGLIDRIDLVHRVSQRCRTFPILLLVQPAPIVGS